MASCAWSAWTMTGRSWRGGGTTASIKTRVGFKKNHQSQTSAQDIWTDTSSGPPPTRRCHGLVQRASDVLGAVHRPEGVCRQPAGERSARGPAGAGRHLRLHWSGSAAPDPQSEHTGTCQTRLLQGNSALLTLNRDLLQGLNQEGSYTLACYVCMYVQHDCLLMFRDAAETRLPGPVRFVNDHRGECNGTLAGSDRRTVHLLLCFSVTFGLWIRILISKI